jgi:hypothetical protein
MQFKTIIEPFRIKMVEPIRQTTRAEREAAAGRGGLQPVPAQGRRRAHRPADRLRHGGDVLGPVGGHDAGRRESYAGAKSFYKFETAVRRITHFKHVIPTHQGPRRRAHPVRLCAQTGRHRAQQHPLRHYAGQHRIPRGRGPRHPHRRSPRPAAFCPSRATSTWKNWSARSWKTPAKCRWR